MVNDMYVTAFPRFSIGLSSQNSLYGAAVQNFHTGLRGITSIVESNKWLSIFILIVVISNFVCYVRV